MSELFSSPQAVFIGSILAGIVYCIRQIFKSKGEVAKAELERDIAHVDKKIADTSLNDLVDRANSRRAKRRRDHQKG